MPWWYKSLLLLQFAVIPYSGLLTLLNFRDCLWLPFFFDIDLCGPTLLGFWLMYNNLVKITSSSRLVFKSTWLWARWSERLILERSSYSEFVDKLLLPMLSSSKGKRDDFNFVSSRTIISWRWLREQSIQFCLWGERALVLPLFFPLTIKPLYVMLVEMGLYCDPRHLKVWRWLCLSDLQFRASYRDFLHAQRFSANFPAPLLGLWWFLNFLIWGLEIHWGNMFNVDQQDWTTDVPELKTFFFTALLQLHDQITRS